MRQTDCLEETFQSDVKSWDCGYPERFAQEALGHNSKAVHRAYARQAQMEPLALGEYERQRAKFLQAEKDGGTSIVAAG